MIRPTFIVIGAAKAGTTSLSKLLGQHPQICFSNPKEPRFFSHDENYTRGWDWYQGCFPGAEKAIAVGEGSVHYSMQELFPQTAARIARDLPEVRLIYIVRHPMDRIASHYRMYHKGRPDYPSLNALVRKPDLWPNFIGASRYWQQIQAYRALFPDEQIRVLFFEEFFQNPEQSAGSLFDFLGVDSQVSLQDARKRHHAALVDKPVLQAARRLPAYRLLSSLLPRRLRKEIRRAYLARRPEQTEGRWDEETYAWAAAQIAGDARTFLEFYGRPQDTWRFEFTVAERQAMV